MSVTFNFEYNNTIYLLIVLNCMHIQGSVQLIFPQKATSNSHTQNLEWETVFQTCTRSNRATNAPWILPKVGAIQIIYIFIYLLIDPPRMS